MPTLVLNYSDSGSGVDTDTLDIQQGGTELGVSCTLGANSATCTPLTPFTDGPVALTATVSDEAGNLSTVANLGFTVDTVAPILNFTAPTEGSTVITDVPTIGLSYSDVGSGVNTGTLAILANGSPLSLSCTFGPKSASCTPTTALPEGPNSLTATIQDLANNPSALAQVNFTVQTVVGNQPPVLDPIGNQIVALGSALSLTLTATDPESAPLAFSASPVPLPANSSLNAQTGVFSFTPSLGQVGVIALTFIVSDGVLTDSETINITVNGPAPGGVTELTGRILDTNDFVLGTETPVVGATVSLLGTGVSTTSDSNGDFTLTSAPSGRQILDIDSTTADPAPDGSSYAGFREEIELIADVTNVVTRPFFLPRIDSGSLTTVDPGTTTVVNNPTLGATLSIPPNTAKNPNGTDFTGQLSISEVPNGLAPASLPDELDLGLLITIQPVGVTFATPVPLTLPNIDGLPAGSELDLWSLDPETGNFQVVGRGRVSVDGTVIETISGGVRAADWHFFLALQLAIEEAIASWRRSLVSFYARNVREDQRRLLVQVV